MTGSKPLRRILIRVDADHGIGLGHAVRCAAVAEALPLATSEPLALTVVGAGAVLPSLFPGITVLPVAADDERAFMEVLASVRPDGVLIDHPTRNDAWGRLVRQVGVPIAVMDDWGGAIDADMIINGTVLDAYHHYDGSPRGARILAGPRYTVLRLAFGRTAWAGEGSEGVVMVAGSGARAAEWAFFLTSAAVDRSGWGRARLVVGGAFPERARLAQACAAAGVTLSVGLSAPELAALLAGSAVALITGGMIVYEALAVGVPAVVYPQLENLIPEARWFAETGCAVDLGPDGGFDGAAVTAAVTRLLANRAAAAALSRQARALIDGDGVIRVAAALVALCCLKAGGGSENDGDKVSPSRQSLQHRG